MNLYERYVLPRLIDLAMRNKASRAERARAIPRAAGAVLEVGIGSGLNLPLYTRVLEGYRAERVRFEAARGPERYQEGLDRLEMTQHLAVTGMLGQFGCIAVKPER